MKKKKAQVWISAILYLLIVSVAIVIILQAGLPLLNKMKDRTTFERSKSTLTSIDQKIVEVASEGEGSQRIVPIDIREGDIIVDGEEDKLKWQLETETEVIEPRTSIQQGSLTIYSNIDVNAHENDTHYEMSNSNLRIILLKYPEKTTTDVDINTIIDQIYFLEDDLQYEVTGNFNFNLCEPSAVIGKLSTVLTPQGDNTNIGSAKVTIHMHDSNTGSCGDRYDLEIILDSEADFIKSRVINVDA